MDVSGEVCRDGCGVGDQEVESVGSEQSIVCTILQTQCVVCSAAFTHSSEYTDTYTVCSRDAQNETKLHTCMYIHSLQVQVCTSNDVIHVYNTHRALGVSVS